MHFEGLVHNVLPLPLLKKRDKKYILQSIDFTFRLVTFCGSYVVLINKPLMLGFNIAKHVNKV